MQRSRSIAVASALRGVCRSQTQTWTRNAAVRRFISTVVAAPVVQQPKSSFSASVVRQQAVRPTQIRTQARRSYASSSSNAPLQKTALYDLHLRYGAKMVPFGGFHMPVQYSSLSVIQSHLFTRSHASLFDVGHMVQRLFSGPGAAQFLERITPSAASALGEHRSTLSCIMHADGSGGIVDDTIVTKLTADKFYVVTNAACRDKDNEYLRKEMAKWNAEPGHESLQVKEEQLSESGLIALQGPEAAPILSLLLPKDFNLRGLLFGHSAYTPLMLPGSNTQTSPVLISRGGYTGEDGFEISIPSPAETVTITEAILSAGGPEKVQLAGLGARDSLRLEAGMCLYGHDLDDTTTPVEGALSWIIPKERRGPDAGYYGAEKIAKQLVPKAKGGEGVERRRVGLIVEGAPAREGYPIVTAEGEKVGVVTSGCPSPSLGKNIAMGYIKEGLHKVGTEVQVVVRGKPKKAVVSKMPFVPNKYWRGESA
ncbi:uncharacterized protein CTHT_0009890 [Thermochaetoides thermophila DSM 1495]|uniref:Aminomethyltransferase n=1 Tax=Chaetomium thermophilum (strain DSM 1495 / CBS 144.50 / IMI 039719) TaxID=759272 RepID=G0S0G0_CHATD|nr:hypothetical protein CTHT_0009890 [Thermochaetoides thermophila DSM 1495]EGS23321.1 hypothetical protein CTHT_0009890 [Thermochaetoides thermophila DSM 1495]